MQKNGNFVKSSLAIHEYLLQLAYFLYQSLTLNVSCQIHAKQTQTDSVSEWSDKVAHVYLKYVTPMVSMVASFWFISVSCSLGSLNQAYP